MKALAPAGLTSYLMVSLENAMAQIQAAELSDRALIALSGSESYSFLQGLVSSDVDQCVPGRAIYTALLTPQGKILYDFFVVADNGGFLIDCAARHAQTLADRLVLYRLRSDVGLTPVPNLGVAAIWATNGARPGLVHHEKIRAVADPRMPALGLRLVGPPQALRSALDALNASPVFLGEYHTYRIALGVPDSSDLPPDTVFALDAGLEELGGVNFKKGCFVGQEVTARMKHRATTRKRFLIVEGDGALPAPGTPVVSAGREVGNMAGAQDGRGLALVRMDRLPEGMLATASGTAVCLRVPGWLHI